MTPRAEAPEPSVELSVVAPLYGNAATLHQLVGRIAKSLEGIDWELILVDDASPDGAGDLAFTLAENESRLGVIALAENGGQSEALRAGVQVARGRKIAFLDADLQDPPEILPRLLEASHGSSVLFGIRRGAYQSWPRRLSSAIYKSLRSRLCRVPPGAGLLLVAEGDLLRQVAKSAPKPCWWIPQLGSLGTKTGALPVDRQTRPTGQSAYRGLMRWKVGLAELSAALRLRLGLPAGPPRHQEPKIRARRLPGGPASIGRPEMG